MFKPVWFTDEIVITGDFGTPRPELVYKVHRGIDTRIFNRMNGDNHYAMVDGKVTEVGFYSKIGWGITYKTEVLEHEGVSVYLKISHLHTKKPTA